MPVTIIPSPASGRYRGLRRPVEPPTAVAWGHARATSTENILAKANNDEFCKSNGVMQSSFGDEVLRTNYITPSNNGFVRAMVHAYSDHHHIVIRPEDVWFSILIQLNYHINKNAEKLRSFFVDHKGQKKLVIVEVGTINTFDAGRFAIRMTHLMQKNIVDPELREWVMPNFSTTTTNDLVTASVLMMGGLQAYFKYVCFLTCGIPSVTLLGERGDWENILGRLEKIPRLGEEPAQFAALLRPVIRRFVASFDNPNDPEVKSFWGRSVDRSIGSGMDYLSGWISAFCFWDSKGVTTYRSTSYRDRLTLDGVEYHFANTEDIPCGSTGVPVTINDNGKLYYVRMVAGSVGIMGKTFEQRLAVSGIASTAAETGDVSSEQQPRLDTIQPISGWWMIQTDEPKDPRASCQDQEVEINTKGKTVEQGVRANMIRVEQESQA